jgi:uncharacterized membrane protein
MTFAKSTLAVLCLAAGAAWSGVAGAQAQTFTFEVCNHSGRSASIAVAAHLSPTDKRWQAEGWWEVRAGQCSTIGNFPQGWFYYYAKSDRRDWPGTDKDKSNTCVRSAKFKRFDPEGYQCAGDEKLAAFNGKRIEDDHKFTWTLD